MYNLIYCEYSYTHILTLSLHDALPISESLRQASFLRDEIEILKPTAVVFFTGPNYDYTLKHEKYFSKAQLRPRSQWWAEVKDRKSTRLNSSHSSISYAVFCLKKQTAVP